MAPPLLAGDFNGDSTIDAGDYIAWKNTFGNAVAPGTGADGNGNGIVDAADYTIWRNNLTGSGSLASVPEPSAAGLIMAGLICFGLCRGRNA